jgi:hypothetical protein
MKDKTLKKVVIAGGLGFAVWYFFLRKKGNFPTGTLVASKKTVDIEPSEVYIPPTTMPIVPVKNIKNEENPLYGTGGIKPMRDDVIVVDPNTNKEYTPLGTDRVVFNFENTNDSVLSGAVVRTTTLPINYTGTRIPTLRHR